MQINKLESQRQLCRIKDDRKVYIQITTKGKKIKDEASNVPNEIGCRVQFTTEEYLNYMKEFDELLINR